MFDFLWDIGDYEDRYVGRYDYVDGFISTARVSDGAQPYETAVADNRYTRSDGKKTIVVVEAYDSVGDAKAGHARWVKSMTEGPLPTTLSDCYNAHIGQMAKVAGERLGAPAMVWTLDDPL